ncbi:LSM domain [Trypanosoma vivax]|nr:U6 snRNA-associated Sm-like protein LSm8p [Trypanosoma vivax]KAH8605401.1 LSM domain [Trypanosoma vivax]
MLSPYLRRRVSVVTTDGRYLVGILHTADQLLNIVLTSCSERVFGDAGKHSETDGAEMTEHPLGVLMIRGCDVVCVAAVNTVEEAKVSTKSIRGWNLPPVKRAPRSAECSSVN